MTTPFTLKIVRVGSASALTLGPVLEGQIEGFLTRYPEMA